MRPSNGPALPPPPPAYGYDRSVCSAVILLFVRGLGECRRQLSRIVGVRGTGDLARQDHQLTGYITKRLGVLSHGLRVV